MLIYNIIRKLVSWRLGVYSFLLTFRSRLKYHFETSRHSRILGWFNKEFIAAGKVEVKFGKIIRNAYQNRTKGDYDAFVDYNLTEVESMHSEMIEFIREIGRLIREEYNPN